MVEVDNHVIKTDDLEVIYKLMDADKDIIKLNKKKDKVWSKLSPLIDNYNARVKETFIRFATEHDDKYFNNVIFNGGYMNVPTLGMNYRIAHNIVTKSSLDYIKNYKVNKARGYDNDFGFVRTDTYDSGSIRKETRQICYWTDVACWASFLSRSHLENKIDKKSAPLIKLDKKWIKKSMDIASKYFKQNKYQNISSLPDDFKSFITDKEKKKYFSQSDPRVLFRMSRAKHKKSKELNKISGGMFKSRKLNKTLLFEFAAINMKGYQAILNSDGEVVPFITGKEMRNSLIDGTYAEYKKQLVENAEHFDEYKEIYFKKTHNRGG